MFCYATKPLKVTFQVKKFECFQKYLNQIYINKQEQRNFSDIYFTNKKKAFELAKYSDHNLIIRLIFLKLLPQLKNPKKIKTNLNT